jgi:hypothetical protein
MEATYARYASATKNSYVCVYVRVYVAFYFATKAIV